MNKPKKYSALRLELGQISEYVGYLLTALLGRKITCVTQVEDDNYWSVSAVKDRFTTSEIMRLISYVHGDSTMIRRSIPIDTNFSRSLDMDLCRALLKHILQLNWEQEFVTREGLWLLGHWAEPVQLPELDSNLLFVDNKTVDCSDLMPMDQFLRKLFDMEGTFSDLSSLCEAYDLKTGTPLYWNYPITDGKYNGCYFVLVREGILKLGYDVTDQVDHEIFDPDSAVLCSAEDLACFLDEWTSFSDRLKSTLNALISYQERKEDGYNA